MERTTYAFSVRAPAFASAGARLASADAQNITSAALLDEARNWRASESASTASCLLAASLMRGRSSLAAVSVGMHRLRWNCLHRSGARCLWRRTHNDPARNSHHGSALGNVAHNQGICGDFCAIAHLDFPYQRRSRADEDIVTQHRSALSSHRRGANGDAMSHVAVGAQYGLGIDVHTSDMPDVQSRPNGRLRIDTHLHEDFAEFQRGK